MTWRELEQKYNIKFILKNGAFRPVNEWLDDIYLRMTPSQVKAMMYEIFEHPELFEDLLVHQQ